MSTSQERRERARAWLRTRPEELRPDATDVAIVAGLNVTSVEVLERMVWNDYDALARSWEGLLTALRSDRAAQQREARSLNDTPAAALPGQVQNEIEVAAVLKMHDARKSELEAYLASQRASGENLSALDDEWVHRALDSPSEAWQGISLRVQRKHKGPIADILATTDLPVKVDGRLGTFDVRPSLEMVHRAEHSVNFTGMPQEIHLSWPATPGSGFTAFRVQSGLNGERPVNFDGRHVETTGSTRVTDTEPGGEGRRFYQVWAYRADDEHTARSTLPTLWAEGVLLDSVRDVRIASQGGQVNGTWVAPAGAGWVEVYRIPKAEHRVGSALSQRHRIGDTQHGANRHGFSDDAVPPGHYFYAFVVAADIDGATRHSLPVEVEQIVHREIAEIEGFTADSDADRASIVVGWQPPADPGHLIEVHLTGREVSEGALGRELDPAALARAGLDHDSHQVKAPHDKGGRAEVVLDWPDDIPRVHVVLVSRVDDACRIAGVRTLVRSQPITAAKLVERVDEQFLTFAWPHGADFVRVFMKPEGADDQATWPKLTELSAKQHADDGGISLTDLPATGTTLALAGCSYEAGQAVIGPMLVLRYPGLTRIRYQLSANYSSKGFLRRTRTTTGISLEVVATPAAPLNVHLVHHRDRVPLHGSDGTRLGQFTLVPEGGSAKVAVDVPVPVDPGYVRLFVDVPDDQQVHYAVLDPAVGQLMSDGER